MTKSLLAAGIVCLSSTMVYAGGLDRSGQSVAAIFEAGNYMEISFGQITPNVTGSFVPAPGVGFESGNIAPSYSQFGFALKADLSEKLSLGVIYDQPFGANVDYSDADIGYPLGLGAPIGATKANVESSGVTALARYKLNENFSIHGGARIVSASGDVTLNASNYASDYSSGSGTGYVVGAAYERPEIAMRVALTYSSSIDLSLNGSLANTLETTLPKSVNLDFQTGIAAGTLLFGSVRWVDWTETELVDSNLPTPLVSYDQASWTYNVGVGRKFSDNLSASISYGYEASQGGAASNLSPTDGFSSLQVGAAYDFGNGLKLSGGVRYVMVGDATTELLSADFSDNSALGVGLKISMNF